MPFQKGHKYSQGRKNIVISTKKKPVKRLGRPPNSLRGQQAKVSSETKDAAELSSPGSVSDNKETTIKNEDAVTIVSSASTVASFTRSSSPISSTSSIRSSAPNSNRSSPNVSRSHSRSRSTSPSPFQQSNMLTEEMISTDARNYRKCLVCENSIHQDELFTHLGNHYYNDTKCKFCDKVATNPCTYVTHISTHTDPQYQCLVCSKWFRQSIVYKKHLKECLQKKQQELNPQKVNENSAPKKEEVELKSTRTRTREAAAAVHKTVPEKPKEEPVEKLRRKRRRNNRGRFEPEGKEGNEISIAPETRLRSQPAHNSTTIKDEDNIELAVIPSLAPVPLALNGGTLANAVASLASQPTKDLTAGGTYKVKIKRPSSVSAVISAHHKENRSNGDYENKVLKDLHSHNSDDLLSPSKRQRDLKFTSLTPSKKAMFECPECDKKFVSYFGLFQHYDTHPELAVTCNQCEITFSNHRALIAHNNTVHKDQQQQAPQLLPSEKTPEDDQTAKQPKNSSSKAPQQSNKPTTNQPNSETLPQLGFSSVVTRNFRLTAPKLNPYLQVANAPLMGPNATQSIHKIGFADLSYVDFSCVNFPRIAQYYCELWPRKIASGTPMHNYTCHHCSFSFPCEAALKMHHYHAKNGTLCHMFMNNPGMVCVNKCLDEIITQIEANESRNCSLSDSDAKRKENFLKNVALVSVNKKVKYEEASKVKMEMRESLLQVNHQFITDIDRWKVSNMSQIHSSASNTNSNELVSNSNGSNGFSNSYQMNMMKIQLKPHVNLNKTLLIKSKKLKRIKVAASSAVYSNSAEIAAILATNSIENIPPPPTQPQSSASSMQTQQLNDKKEVRKDVNSSKKDSGKAAGQVVKDVVKKETATTSVANLKLSQPTRPGPTYVSVTSGNFSGSSVSLQPKKRKWERRNLPNGVNQVKQHYKKRQKNLDGVKPTPPPLLKPDAGAADRTKPTEMPKLIAKPKSHEMPKLQPIAPLLSSKEVKSENGARKQLPVLTKFPKTNSIENYEPVLKLNDNASLKCKVCGETYKKEHEFLTHFIDAHQLMLRERLSKELGSNSNRKIVAPGESAASAIKHALSS